MLNRDESERHVLKKKKPTVTARSMKLLVSVEGQVYRVWIGKGRQQDETVWHQSERQAECKARHFGIKVSDRGGNTVIRRALTRQCSTKAYVNETAWHQGELEYPRSQA